MSMTFLIIPLCDRDYVRSWTFQVIIKEYGYPPVRFMIYRGLNILRKRKLSRELYR
jgi:hypothetical protein